MCSFAYAGLLVATQQALVADLKMLLDDVQGTAFIARFKRVEDFLVSFHGELTKIRRRDVAAQEKDLHLGLKLSPEGDQTLVRTHVIEHVVETEIEL